MVQGGLSETQRRCGKPTCQCARLPTYPHGPHLYLTYRDDGTNRSLYVPPEHEDVARVAHEAWAAFWTIGCAIAEMNREQLGRAWQGGTPPRPGPSRRRARAGWGRAGCTAGAGG